MGLVKPVLFGFIIATVGCYYGMTARGGTQGVGRATTQAVVAASVLIVVVDFFVTQLLMNVLSYQVAACPHPPCLSTPLPPPARNRPRTRSSFEDVHLAFEDNEVLRGVSFHLPFGETKALFGVAGSGKSTILKLALGPVQAGLRANHWCWATT